MVEKQLEYILFHLTDFFWGGLLNFVKKYKLDERKIINKY